MADLPRSEVLHPDTEKLIAEGPLNVPVRNFGMRDESLQDFARRIALHSAQKEREQVDGFLKLLEVYLVNGIPRFAIHGEPARTDEGFGYGCAREAVHAAISRRGKP